MEEAQGTSTPAGTYLARPGGHYTFEPAPLPRRLELTAGTHAALSEADRALGFLHGQTAGRDRARAVLGMACRREAVASCALEGSDISLRDLLWWEQDGARAAGLQDRRGSARICANYAAILGSMLEEPVDHEQDAGAPVSRKRLCTDHSRLFRGLRGREERPGRIRDTEIWLGPVRSTARSAHFVPPAPEHIATHLDRLQEFLRTDVALPPLAKVALVAYQLETIHPFVDGSGRVARLCLVHLLRSVHGQWPQLLCPSVRLAADIGEHFRQLQGLRRGGDWDAWIRYFARCLRDAAEGSTTTVAAAEEMLREHENLVGQRMPGLTASAISLLRVLASKPLVAVADVAVICGRTYANANVLVGRLEALGLLVEITGRRRHRRYVYTPYAGILA